LNTTKEARVPTKSNNLAKKTRREESAYMGWQTKKSGIQGLLGGKGLYGRQMVKIRFPPKKKKEAA